ncbi:hypothetical protein Ahy_B04g069702 isoform E [Arachis hypogaea]|uniref:Uncharacterized protein n=1 Tax=Arachis hypogaea TaxID=3818 RepID=A0A444ZDA7_ARAHY|nr:hypothetical protein Ahy_B04g069702 isoform E [Arachis hypogaea]
MPSILFVALQAIALTVVSIGVAVATVTDLQFHFFGACVALAWIVLSATDVENTTYYIDFPGRYDALLRPSGIAKIQTLILISWGRKALRKMIEPFCLKQGLHDHHQQNSMDHQQGLHIHEELIDFLKETRLESSAAATRNASTKLLGVLHRFVGPGSKVFPVQILKGSLLMLSLHCSGLLILSMRRIHEVCSPKRSVKTSDSSSLVAAGGLDSLPREDISGKITSTLLKNLESPSGKFD